MGAPQGSTSEVKMVAEISVYCHPELKDLAGKQADREGIPLSEYIARVLADRLDRPDLRAVPRKSIGRPRKKLGVAS